MKLIGVDFTSAPSRRKPITAAHGRWTPDGLCCDAVSEHADWASFEALLAAPGPWLGAFDFPFGLPREGVEDLGWPLTWPDLVAYCASLGKSAFKQALDAYRESRPFGQRYPHRATDQPAGSHSPFKLVNPPVGLMYLAGAPRLLAAGVSVPGMLAGDPARIAVEAYPGLVARQITRASYKSDERRRQTPERRDTRALIVGTLRSSASPAPRLQLDDALQCRAIDDGSGDTLDAMLALTQAAQAWLSRENGYGLPRLIDPVEGWIVGVDAPG